MARRVFFSFHYEADNWRAAKVRNMGVIDGNRPATDNDWEQVTKRGDDAIRRWIDGQMKGRTCAVVLIGSRTAGRKWIDYEIKKAWDSGLGLLGIHIHNLGDRNNRTSAKGANPFNGFMVGRTPMTQIVGAYDPPYRISSLVYNYINMHIQSWIDDAVHTRSKY